MGWVRVRARARARARVKVRVRGGLNWGEGSQENAHMRLVIYHMHSKEKTERGFVYLAGFWLPLGEFVSTVGCWRLLAANGKPEVFGSTVPLLMFVCTTRLVFVLIRRSVWR